MTNSSSEMAGGQSLTIRVPIMACKRGGRRLVLMPGDQCQHRQTGRTDNTMIKALARAYRWKHLIESGGYASLAELAETEEVNQSYLCRILRLTLLAPDIVEAILDGRQSALLQLDALLKPLPVGWEAQRELFQGDAQKTASSIQLDVMP